MTLSMTRLNWLLPGVSKAQGESSERTPLSRQKAWVATVPDFSTTWVQNMMSELVGV